MDIPIGLCTPWNARPHLHGYINASAYNAFDCAGCIIQEHALRLKKLAVGPYGTHPVGLVHDPWDAWGGKQFNGVLVPVERIWSMIEESFRRIVSHIVGN